MEEIKIKILEIKILKDTYLIFIYEKENFTEFYVSKKDYGIIKFAIGVNLNEINKTLEDFVNDNLIEWIYNYNLDMEE